MLGPNGAFAPEGYEFNMAMHIITGNKELDEKSVIYAKVHLHP